MRHRSLVLVSAFIFLTVLLPTTASALEGRGPRVTVTGTVQEVHISEKQAFEQVGAEVVVKANNGQIVTVIINKDSEIVSEGRLSRKLLIPANIVLGMEVRVRGWRIDSQSLTASLFVILNVEVNPALSYNGILQSVDNSSITILSPDGHTRTFTVTPETEVNLSYTVRGATGLSLIGKQALLTMNPSNSSQIRILRITGLAPSERTAKPLTTELKRR